MNRRDLFKRLGAAVAGVLFAPFLGKVKAEPTILLDTIPFPKDLFTIHAAKVPAEYPYGRDLVNDPPVC